MKKIYALILVAISLFTVMGLSACGKKTYSEETVAVVDEAEITDEDIANRRLYNEIMNEVHQKQFNETLYEEDAAEQIKKHSLPTDEKEILETLIKEEVIRQELGDDALSLEEIQKTVTDEFELIKSSQENYYKNIMEVIRIKGVTEEDYLSLTSLYGYGLFNITKIRRNYSEKDYDKDSKQSFDEQFDEYVNGLIADADIESVNNR